MTGQRGRNPTDLDGRTALITGGAQGLGYAIAKRLADNGAAVTIVDLAAALDRADLPETWMGVPIDLAAPDAEEMMAGLAEKFSSIDILVANAGLVPPWRGVADLDMDEWNHVFRVNVAGVALTLKCFAQALARSENGSVIIMASINAYKAHGSQVLYSASKHAVLGIMRAAALDLGKQGTRVNAIAPGPIATDALVSRVSTRHESGAPAPTDVFAEFANDTALGRMATQNDVADVALYLACDLSGAMTGALLPVECGLS